MNMKLVAGGIGLLMLIAFMLPPVVKLHNLSLAAVVLIGVAMAIYEFIENVRNRDD